MAGFSFTRWSHSAAQYARRLMALMPTGAAWPAPSDMGSTLGLLLTALAQELGRLDARVGDMVREMDPATANELMPEWEAVLGLPDPCVTTTQTLPERRTAASTKLTMRGGQSRQFFIDLAASLGYTITIDEFHSAAEATAAGITFTGDQWAHIWRVNVPVSTSVRYFRVGSSTAGEPLRDWGDAVFECRFNHYKPAHTQVVFAYAP